MFGCNLVSGVLIVYAVFWIFDKSPLICWLFEVVFFLFTTNWILILATFLCIFYGDYISSGIAYIAIPLGIAYSVFCGVATHNDLVKIFSKRHSLPITKNK